MSVSNEFCWWSASHFTDSWPDRTGKAALTRTEKGQKAASFFCTSGERKNSAWEARRGKRLQECVCVAGCTSWNLICSIVSAFPWIRSTELLNLRLTDPLGLVQSLQGLSAYIVKPHLCPHSCNCSQLGFPAWILIWTHFHRNKIPKHPGKLLK